MPQRYTATDNSTGKSVTFDWNAPEPPTDADMEEVFAAARASAPEESTNPYAKPKNYGTMTREQKIEWHMNDPFTKGAATGGVTGGALTPAREAVKGAAKAVMGKALGSQTAVMDRFPTVDLAEEALKHGTNPKTLRGLGKAAAQNVVAQGKAADAAGMAPITQREVIGGLRPIYDRAVKSEGSGVQGARDRVMNVVSGIRRQMPRQGQSISDALVGKSEWQQMGKEAAKAAPGDLKSPTSRIANEVGGTLTGLIRGRGFEPLNNALDDSQSLMALQRAAKTMSYRPSLLQMILGGTAGGATGAMTGDWQKAATAAALPLAMSPQGLSMLARGINGASPAVTPALEGIYRALLGASAPDSPDGGPRR